MSMQELIINALGFGLIAITVYMLYTRWFSPQFLFPWQKRRRQEEIQHRGEQLMTSGQLTEDEQLQVERALNTLKRRRHVLSQPGNHGDPLTDAHRDIDELWQRHQGEGNQNALPTGADRQ